MKKDERSACVVKRRLVIVAKHSERWWREESRRSANRLNPSGNRSLSYPKFKRCIERTHLKIALPLADPAIEEIADQRRHFVELVLERKVARIEEIELDFREVSLVGVRPVGRKDLNDAEQEASGEYRMPTGDLTVTSPWGLGHNHLVRSPVNCSRD